MMLGLSLYAYVGLVLLYRASETLVMARPTRRRARDWTASLISVPYYLILTGAPLEYLYWDTKPGPLHWIPGALFFLAATALRVRGHLDLKQGFSMFIERVEGQSLVRRGIYAHIRHPLYLGNVCLFVACPLFLAARWTWVATVLGVLGILVRIRIEERFLMEHMEGYAAYREETWALIPGLF
jgi:protein-S-isoprenylcysteine O-methyltransferase Ste14